MIINIFSFGFGEDYKVDFDRGDTESLDNFLSKKGYNASNKQLAKFKEEGEMAVFEYCRKQRKYIVTAIVTDVTEQREKEEEHMKTQAWIAKAETIIAKHDASVFMSDIDLNDIERLQKLNRLVRSRNERIQKLKAEIEKRAE